MALAAGDVQTVGGVLINVRKFVHKDLRESVRSKSSIGLDQLGENNVNEFASSGQGESDTIDTSSVSSSVGSVGAESNADDARSSTSSNADNTLLVL